MKMELTEERGFSPYRFKGNPLEKKVCRGMVKIFTYEQHSKISS